MDIEVVKAAAYRRVFVIVINIQPAVRRQVLRDVPVLWLPLHCELSSCYRK